MIFERVVQKIEVEMEGKDKMMNLMDTYLINSICTHR